MLFEGAYFLRVGFMPRAYDLSPDGKKFVMIQREDKTAPDPIQVVQNWFEELERLAPTN